MDREWIKQFSTYKVCIIIVQTFSYLLTYKLEISFCINLSQCFGSGWSWPLQNAHPNPVVKNRNRKWILPLKFNSYPNPNWFSLNAGWRIRMDIKPNRIPIFQEIYRIRIPVIHEKTGSDPRKIPKSTTLLFTEACTNWRRYKTLIAKFIISHQDIKLQKKEKKLLLHFLHT